MGQCALNISINDEHGCAFTAQTRKKCLPHVDPQQLVGASPPTVTRAGPGKLTKALLGSGRGAG